MADPCTASEGLSLTAVYSHMWFLDIVHFVLLFVLFFFTYSLKWLFVAHRGMYSILFTPLSLNLGRCDSWLMFPPSCDLCKTLLSRPGFGSEQMMWNDLLCKYCKEKKKHIRKTMSEKQRKINGSKWKSYSNDVMMLNVIRNIFLYFKIVLGEKGQNTNWGKNSATETLQRECFYYL